MRFRVEPRDVPAPIAARRLGLTETKFNELYPRLRAGGFPAPDDVTGNYDLDAIDEWRKRRNPHLFNLSPAPPMAKNADDVIRERLKRATNG